MVGIINHARRAWFWLAPQGGADYVIEGPVGTAGNTWGKPRRQRSPSRDETWPSASRKPNRRRLDLANRPHGPPRPESTPAYPPMCSRGGGEQPKFG